MGGASEPQFRAMIKSLNWGWHKYGDVRYCIHCHKPLPKTEQMPDFGVFPKPVWVEVKNSDSSGSWAWAGDIGPEGARKNQRQFLIDHGGWLFIEIGKGRRPNDYGAWLIQISAWQELELALEQKSLPLNSTKQLMGAKVVLIGHELRWVDGHWSIPKGHSWWYYLANQTKELLKQIEEQL